MDKINKVALYVRVSTTSQMELRTGTFIRSIQTGAFLGLQPSAQNSNN